MSAGGPFDYVIVGSGSGGSVVARRLVDAGATVALIEAGSRDRNPAIHDPGRWPELPHSPEDWAWQTDPQEACHGRRLYWPRGKVLGGTSTMNGMAFIRGHRLDFDGWAYHGCPGWAWETCSFQHHHVHLFWRSHPGLRVHDTQPVGFHLPLGADWFELPDQGWTLTPGLVRTQSRGAVRLTSADPGAPLSLDPRALTVGADLDALAAAVELMREVGRRPALAECSAGELYPGPEVRTRDEVREYVRRSFGSYHHQVGTCKMGQDSDAVVDPELRVYGVEGLRVADASIMPFITTGNTNAPTFMIGEKASDLLLAAHGREVATGAAVG